MMPRALLLTFAVLLLTVLALGGYMLVLKHRAAESARHVDTRPLAPPVAGSTEQVMLYVANDSRGILEKQGTNLALPSQPSERARELLRALLGEYVKRPSPHELAAGADIRNVYLLPNRMVVVDTTAPFADGHRSGIFVETLTVASLVQTLVANQSGIARVKILVDGKERETLAGHADLSRFYDVNEVSELVKGLQ